MAALLFGIMVIGLAATVVTFWADAIAHGHSPASALCNHLWCDWLPCDPFDDAPTSYSCMCVKCSLVRTRFGDSAVAPRHDNL